MAQSESQQGAAPAAVRLGMVRDGVLWLALAAACSRVLTDLASHWSAEPWTLYSALFAPLLLLACWSRPPEAGARPSTGTATGYLYLFGGLAIVAATVGGGMPRLARVALPFAIVGTARVLGRPAPAVAWLALWLVPIPSVLADVAARSLEPAWAMLSHSTARCPRGAALLPLMALLAGLGHYAALRRSRHAGQWIRSAALWGLCAIPLQALVWLAARFAPDITSWAWPGIALCSLALIERIEWKQRKLRRRDRMTLATANHPPHPAPQRTHEALGVLAELAPGFAAVLEESLRAAGRPPLGRIELIPPSNPWADDPAKFRVFDATGAVVAVALLSNPNGPQLIAQAMARARAARNALGETLGRVVIEPLAEGELAGRSYAILPYCRPLSDSRAVWAAQRALLRGPVLRWLRGVARQTQTGVGTDGYLKSFRDPLTQLAGLSELPEHLREQAKVALTRLENGEWQPRHVLVHNDLWKGNLLIEVGAGPLDWRERFVVIDWPGSLQRGYPMVDLIRIARSLRLSARALQAELDAHCQILGCVRADARSNLLAGLGKLGMDLDQFPLEDYVDLVKGCVATLDESYPQ